MVPLRKLLVMASSTASCIYPECVVSAVAGLYIWLSPSRSYRSLLDGVGVHKTGSAVADTVV